MMKPSDKKPGTGCLRKDPVESSDEWKKIADSLERDLDKIFKGEKRHMGFCFRYWSVKKEILRKKYGIEWHSPAEMNPTVRFD